MYKGIKYGMHATRKRCPSPFASPYKKRFYFTGRGKNGQNGGGDYVGLKSNKEPTIAGRYQERKQPESEAWYTEKPSMSSSGWSAHRSHPPLRRGCTASGFPFQPFKIPPGGHRGDHSALAQSSDNVGNAVHPPAV